MLKALLDNVFVFLICILDKLCLVFDLSPYLLCSFLMTNSCRYFGICLLSNLNIGMSVLKSILCSIGNQCNSLRHSVVLSLELLFKMIFYICCNAFIDFFAGLQVCKCSSLVDIELMI